MLTGVIGVDLNWKKLTRKKNIWEHHMAATHVEKILEVIYQLSTFTRVPGSHITSSLATYVHWTRLLKA